MHDNLPLLYNCTTKFWGFAFPPIALLLISLANAPMIHSDDYRYLRCNILLCFASNTEPVVRVFFSSFWRLTSVGATLLKVFSDFFVRFVNLLFFMNPHTNVWDVPQSYLPLLKHNSISHEQHLLINPSREKFCLQPEHKYSLTLSKKWETNATNSM